MRTVILGGGISGLLAAWVLRDQKPVLLEAKPEVGGAYLAGGLKYIRNTWNFRLMLKLIGVDAHQYSPCGMLLFGQRIREHPDWLLEQPPWLQRAIQASHWLKTRGGGESLQGFRSDCMNAPKTEARDKALSCDHRLLFDRLIWSLSDHNVDIRTGVRIEHVSRTMVCYSGGSEEYDRLVVTIPLAAISKLAPWAHIPSATPNKLTIMDVGTNVVSVPSWDYLYTPMLPCVSRITWTGKCLFQVEAPGDHTQSAVGMFDDTREALSVMCDGNRSSLVVEAVKKPVVIPGHLPMLGRKIMWPKNWIPLGRFTEWNPRATAEKVLDRAVGMLS